MQTKIFWFVFIEMLLRKSSQSSELHFDEVSKNIKNDDNSNIIEEEEEIFQVFLKVKIYLKILIIICSD